MSRSKAAKQMEHSAEDDLTYLRGQISEYPEYGSEDDRLLSDRMIRAWVGSTLALVRERLASALDAATVDRLDQLLFRCEFPDQRFVVSLEHANLSSEAVHGLVAGDRRLVELANQVRTAEAPALPAILEEIEATFDSRTPVSA